MVPVRQCGASSSLSCDVRVAPLRQQAPVADAMQPLCDLVSSRFGHMGPVRNAPMNQETPITVDSVRRPGVDTAFGVIVAISLCHLLNDMMQSLLPAIYPVLKQELGLNFGQIGLIT